MKLSILTFLTLAGTSNAAFVPPHKLVQMTQPLRSTVNPSSIGADESQKTTTPSLNEDKFLDDMDSALGELNQKKKPATTPSKKKRGPVAFPDPIPADPQYITEARLRLAALADRADERVEHFAWEARELKSKSVWDSFRKAEELPPTANLVKYKDLIQKDAKKAAFMGSVSTTDPATTTGSSGGGFIGLALVLAAVAVVEPATVTDFLNNLDLDLSKFGSNIDLTAIQTQAQATAAAVSDYVGSINVEMPKMDLDLSSLQAQAAAVTDFVGDINVEMPKLDLDLDLSGIQAQAQAQAAAVTDFVSSINVEIPSVNLDVDLSAIQEQVQATGAAVTDFVGNVDVEMPNVQLDVDLSVIQEQVQATVAASQETIAKAATQLESSSVAMQSNVAASVGSWKDTAMNLQASSDLGTTDSSAALIGAKEDLEALLRQ